MLSGYSQELRILPPILTSQILIVFEMRTLILNNSRTLKISILLLDIVRVLSGVANLASDYGCSTPCIFRDMTFFLAFSKFFRNFRLKNFHKI